MSDANDSPDDDVPEYRSPKRCLALSFRLSRDRWKLKAGERLAALRASRVRIRDLGLSRDLWKRKALHYEQILRDKGLPMPPEEAEPDPPPQVPPTVPAPPALAEPEPDSKKKDAPQPMTPDAPAASGTVRGQHFDLDRIWLCLSFILAGRSSLRAVPRLCRVVDARDGLEGLDVPDWTTSRTWLLRLGLAQMRRPVIEADDWVWMVDHSVQLGRDRLLAVLGGRLSEMPAGGPLRRCDLRLLHLAVMRDPNMASNRDELLGLARRTGVPRVLLSDHGADLRGGVRLLGEALGPSAAERMLNLYDVKHRTALALKHRLEGCPRWAEFLGLVGATRNALRQTEWAFLLPPVLRSKSRYLNLGELVPWACKLRRLLEHEPKTLLEHGQPEKLRQKMGWLLGFGADLHLWQGWYRVAARTEEVIRTRGLYRGVEQNLELRLSGLVRDEPTRQMAGELRAFVAGQSSRLSPGERVPGSTEVLESCFGTLKALERDQSKGGFTGLVLGLGALVGKVTKDAVAQALGSTPAKAVRNWCIQNVGTSMQSKRRQAFRLAGS